MMKKITFLLFLFGAIFASNAKSFEDFESAPLAYPLMIPPSNDQCTNAIALTVDAAAIQGTTVDATGGSGTSCDGSIGNDVWYTVTGTGDDLIISVESTTAGQRAQIGIFESADCSGITLGSCDFSEAGGTAVNPVTLAFPTVSGTLYYIQIGNWVNGEPDFNFDVQVITAPPAPANDDCVDAIALIVDDPAIQGTTVSASGASATSCNGSIGNDVWYTVTGTGDNLILTVESTTPGRNAQIGVFESADCSGITLGSCAFSAGGGTGINPVSVVIPSVSGTLYYIQTGNFINGQPDIDFNIQVTTGPSTPPNDACVDAITLMDGDSVTGDTTFANNIEGLSACQGGGGSAVTGCSGGTGATNFGAGVWYVYSALPNQVITVTTDNSPTTFDTEIQVFSGDCSNLVCIGGDDDGGAIAALSTFCWESLTSADYYIYVDGHNTNSGEFVLDITVEDVCFASAGTLTADFTPVQLAGTDVAISATEDTAPTVPENYDVVYVLTMGTDLTIMGTNATPDFTVTAPGDYTIHTLVGELNDSGDPNFLDTSVINPGVTTGADVLDLIDNGGSPLCADLLVSGAEFTVEACSADAGTLTADLTPVQLVGDDVVISASEDTMPTVPANYDLVYVLTMGTDLTIMGTNTTAEFTVDTPGDYTIHTLVAELDDANDPNFLDTSVIDPGVTTGADVLDLIDNTGNPICADLLVAGAQITVEACSADAGTLTADLTPVQLAGADVVISATEDTAPTVPANYDLLYVLTMGTDLTIMDTNTDPEFTVTAVGDYTIHTLVAELDDSNDPNFLDVSVIVIGTTTGVDVLNIINDANNPLCADLLVSGAEITVEACSADAGTLTADFTPVQLAGADVAISATEDTAPTVPENYDVVYVLTMGTDLTIMGTNTTADFTVTAAGDYTIHTLVAELDDSNDPNFLDTSVIDPGVTTGADVLALIDNGGSPLCADLLVMGAEITVEACSADAGTLTADFTPVQLSGADVAISATEDVAPTVPGDYDVLYVLTMGTDLTIMGTNATPDFTVTAAGDYTIHTLVAELDDTDDPNYVDLAGLVTVGTTTGVDVVTAITDNGLCADLLVMGAEITVEACGADAGTLTADFTPVQLSGADVAISATEGTAPTVPANYDVLYVLTMGTDLIIMGTNTTADFTVTAAGDYTIHTLVAELDDTDDPNYVDLGALVTVGTTTGVDVVTAITDNGLCADLLVMGAEVTVEACGADAGTLTADLATVQLAGADVAISATEDTAPTVPANYDVLYVLTMGTDLTIMGTNATPDFTVTAAGDYTIHTLVAELDDTDDPNYVDLGALVTIGTTTGVDVVTAITNNGLCADLLVMGAEITVETCSAQAGTLTADATPVDLAGAASITISATEDTAPTVPANYDISYVLTMGTDLVIMQAGANPSFDVTEIGDYTIHTLVAETTDANDPNFIDLAATVTFGTTTGVDVVNLITNSGICADLLVAGAEIEVEDSLSNDAFTKDSFSYYPNPIENELHFRAQSQIDNVTILNMLGQEVMSVSPMAIEADLDTSSIAAGTYFARVTIGNASKTIKVIKE